MKLSPAAEAFLSAVGAGLADFHPTGRRAPRTVIRGGRGRATSGTIVDYMITARMIQLPPGPWDAVRAWKLTDRGRAYLARMNK